MKYNFKFLNQAGFRNRMPLLYIGEIKIEPAILKFAIIQDPSFKKKLVIYCDLWGKLSTNNIAEKSIKRMKDPSKLPASFTWYMSGFKYNMKRKSKKTGYTLTISGSRGSKKIDIEEPDFITKLECDLLETRMKKFYAQER